MISRVLIVAGGTGGHVFPALAVAKALLRNGVEVQWLGTERGIESRVVPQANIPIHYISISGWRGKRILQLLSAPWRLTRAIYQSLQVINRYQPDIVLGMGGFVSGPGGVAAWLKRKRVLIHEQNAIAGMTNRLLLRFAQQAFAAYPNAFAVDKKKKKKPNSQQTPSNNQATSHIKANNSKIMVTGNPVRAELLQLPPPKQRLIGQRQKLQLFIQGGSQGALVINEVVVKAIAALPVELRPIIWHQTGKHYFTEVQEMYRALGVEARVEVFIEQMAEAYTWADIVLCRAGASTLAELMAVGLGSVLIPYPYAVDDHQTHNAQFLVDQAAAMLIPQPQLNEHKLAEIIADLTTNRDKLLAMAEAAYTIQGVDATTQIVNYCLNLQRTARHQ